MHCLSIAGSLSAAHTFSLAAGMRWLSFICMGWNSLYGLREDALSATPFHRDLRQNRHRDFLRRDGAEIEAGRRFDAVDRRGINAFGDEFVAQCRHLAAAADKGMIGGLG